MEDFSVVIIAKNEEKVIERLLKSLKGCNDIVVMDTGSTDKTVEIAKKYGRVVEVGDKFIEIPTVKDISTFKQRYGFAPSFTTETKLFNYSAARNYAMTLAKNDWCFQPDADEVVEWNIDEVRKLLPNNDHLVYRFVFAHNPDGTPALEFSHSKFFRRSKVKWVKKVHEVHTNRCEDTKPPFYTDKIYHHHYQIRSENRNNYLPKLEYAILETENDDRNTYYLAREYFYVGRYETAIKMFETYRKLKAWLPEVGQSLIFTGLCYKALNNIPQAKEFFHKAMIVDDSRREAFWELSQVLEPRSAVIYLKGALEIPYNPNYYLNQMNLYTWEIHDKLALLYAQLGNKEESKKHWQEALKASPNDERIKGNILYYYPELDLRKHLPEDTSNLKVLNVGACDTSELSRQLHYIKFKQLDMLDIHKPYLDEIKKETYKTENINLIHEDITKFKKFKNYDYIFLFDVLEHLEKRDAHKLMTKIKKNNVIMFIPVEQKHRENNTGVKSQDHKSFWQEFELMLKEYETQVLENNGVKMMWAVKKKLIK